MIDLDHAEEAPVSNLVNELMFPDRENHIAYRDGSRQVARLVRGGSGRARLTIPDEQGWRLTPAEDGTLERLHPAPAPRRPLQQGEVRVAVEAAGLNFRGVLISLGAIDSDMPMGEEFCGRIVEVASNVAGLTVGDRVVGLGFGAFAPEIVTRAELVAPAPAGVQAAALAAIPSAFMSAELAFQMARFGPATGCWSIRLPAAWGWRPSSWLKRQARKCSLRPAPLNRPISGRWASPTSSTAGLLTSVKMSWRPQVGRA